MSWIWFPSIVTLSLLMKIPSRPMDVVPRDADELTPARGTPVVVLHARVAEALALEILYVYVVRRKFPSRSRGVVQPIDLRTPFVLRCEHHMVRRRPSPAHHDHLAPHSGNRRIVVRPITHNHHVSRVHHIRCMLDGLERCRARARVGIRTR